MELPIFSEFPESQVEEFYAYGFAQYGRGDWNEAATVFRVLCTRRPFESRFWFGLGATLQESANYHDALHAWAMASLLKASDPLPHFHAAECYLSIQNTKDAAKALCAAELRIDPTDPLRGRIDLLKKQWSL